MLIELGKSWRAPTSKFWESESGYATVLSFHAISTNIKAFVDPKGVDYNTRLQLGG